MCPKTTGGKLFCIFYGTVGIPLSMLAIAVLGKFIYEAICGAAKRIRRFWSNGSEGQDSGGNTARKLLLLGSVLLLMCLTAVLMWFWEDLDVVDCVYFR